MRILTNGYGYGYGCGGTTSDTRIDPVERRKAEENAEKALELYHMFEYQYMKKQYYSESNKSNTKTKTRNLTNK